MLSIYAVVHYSGALEGWSRAEVEALDVLNTEYRLMELLTERIQQATGVDDVTVEIRSDDAGDDWEISGAASAREERDLDEVVRDVLVDFPWWDGNVWAVER